MVLDSVFKIWELKEGLGVGVYLDWAYCDFQEKSIIRKGLPSDSSILNCLIP